LQDAAWKRGLFRYAVDLDRRAAIAGSGDALIRIVERTATHPDADRIAHWAAVRVDLSRAQQVNRLFDTLNASEAQEAIDALAHRLIAQTDPADSMAVGALATSLASNGVSPEVVQALVNSLVSQADLLKIDALAFALPNLQRVSTDVSFRLLAQRAVDNEDAVGYPPD
jgi:hypothetical protein